MKKILISELNEFKRNEYTEDMLILHHAGSIYGIGASIKSQKAIKKINELKQRPKGKSFITLIPNWDWFKKFDFALDFRANLILRKFWPGNLTAILKSKNEQFDYLKMNGTIAVRMSKSAELRKAMEILDIPIVSTSINKSNNSPVTSYDNIIKYYEDWFDFEIVSNEENESTSSSTIVNFNKKIELIREGDVSFPLIMEHYYKPKILFVCSGNTCRSPLAEYYLRYLSEKNNISLEVKSVGLNVTDFQISKESKKLLYEMGIDAENHIPKQLTKDDLKWATVIFPMTIKQKHTIEEQFIGEQFNIHLLNEILEVNDDIEDPYGQTFEVYNKVFQLIKNNIEVLVQNLGGNE